jgi:hypothetical protein
MEDGATNDRSEKRSESDGYTSSSDDPDEISGTGGGGRHYTGGRYPGGPGDSGDESDGYSDDLDHNHDDEGEGDRPDRMLHRSMLERMVRRVREGRAGSAAGEWMSWGGMHAGCDGL